MDGETWMKDLHSQLKRISIFHLAIPGSHDSLSFSVSKRSSVAPDAPGIVKLLNKICGPLLRKVVYNWSVTQNVGLYQQFKLGIRYYDLRVAVKGSKIYSCHGLYGMNIVDALEILNHALCSNPQEVVILDFQHFYGFKDVNHLFLVDTLYSIFGERLCTLPKNLSHVTLHWLQERGIQVIVIYRNEYANEISYVWPSSTWITMWPDTTNIKELCTYLTDNLKRRPNNIGFVSQCVFTPSLKFICFHLLSTLKNKCAVNCDKEIKSMWIEKQRSLSPKGVNVIIADFVDLKEVNFCSCVVNINYKSLSTC